MIVKQTPAYSAFFFSVVLCVMAVVGNIYGSWVNGKVDPAMPAFLCFLPMCFFFVANALTDSRNRIETLEARIKQLEAEKQA